MTQDEEIASSRRCGMCANAPCTCGSGPVYHVAVPRWRIEKLEREHARYQCALALIQVTDGIAVDNGHAPVGWKHQIIARQALAPDQGGAE